MVACDLRDDEVFESAPRRPIAESHGAASPLGRYLSPEEGLGSEH